jgi:hypothetical protein
MKVLLRQQNAHPSVGSPCQQKIQIVWHWQWTLVKCTLLHRIIAAPNPVKKLANIFSNFIYATKA